LIRAALHENADIVGASRHPSEHLEYVPELMTLPCSEAIAIDAIRGGSATTAGDVEIMRQPGVTATFGADNQARSNRRRHPALAALGSNACAAIHGSEPSATRSGAFAHSWRKR